MRISTVAFRKEEFRIVYIEGIRKSGTAVKVFSSTCLFLHLSSSALHLSSRSN